MTVSEVDHVFNELADLYGNKFTSEWGAFDEGERWLAELSHLSPRHLELGITRCREQVREAARSGDEAWPPQPVAFATLCEPRPEDLGMPLAAEAWREVCAHSHEPTRHEWSHEAVRLAGQSVGWWDLTHGGGETKASRMEKRFAREYQALVNKVMAGLELVPQHLLESDQSKSAAELAERAGREAAQAQAEAAGLPQRMTGRQGLAALRGALGRE